MVNSLVQRNFMSTIQELESYKVSIWECNKLPKPPSSSLSSTKNLNYYVIGWQQADLCVVRVIGCFVLMRLTTSILLALILNISLPLFGAKALITFSFCLKEYQKMKTGLEGDRAYLPKLFTVKFVYLIIVLYFRLKICSHLCTDQTDPRIDAVQPNKLKISIP